MNVAAFPKAMTDPVAGGFYTVGEAARLLGIGNSRVIIEWLKGRTGRSPVILRQYEPINNTQELGFLDLIEVRFIDHFRKQGYSLQSLRRAAEVARAELDTQHPFARYGVEFLVERKNLFLRVAQDMGDSKLLNLVTRQYAMYEVLEKVLEKGLKFDTSGLVTSWHPKSSEYPHVVVDPTVAYGQPALEPSRVPTATLFAAFKAENGDYASVAEWYQIEERMVRQAVEFELALPN